MGQIKSKKQKVKRYAPELGQFAFGSQAWQSYEMPEYAEALLNYIFDEIERVYWNINQKQWERYQDPKLKQIKIRPYWWGDENSKMAKLANFEYNGVGVSWYKYPGRGMSVDVKWKPTEWVYWFDGCMEHLRKLDKADERKN